VTYSPDAADLYRRAARYVTTILAGAYPGRPPNRAADQIRAGHQYQDRKALGIEIPPSLLARVDQVIE
jgi:putative tryptophan/tyrosine transport system substrate-binding protein